MRERFIGSLPGECLDHVFVLGGRQLVRVLAEYSEYFNQSWPHTCTCACAQRRCKCQGLAQQTPESSGPGLPTAATGKLIAFPTSALSVQRTSAKIIALPILNRLHHSYAWAT
jgi:hypothetical protein